jgi:hypothetical protein
MPDLQGEILIAISKHALSDLYRGNVCRQLNRMATGNGAARVEEVKTIEMHRALPDSEHPDSEHRNLDFGQSSCGGHERVVETGAKGAPTLPGKSAGVAGSRSETRNDEPERKRNLQKGLRREVGEFGRTLLSGQAMRIVLSADAS